jgi:hypothetical protein
MDKVSGLTSNSNKNSYGWEGIEIFSLQMYTLTDMQSWVFCFWDECIRDKPNVTMNYTHYITIY